MYDKTSDDRLYFSRRTAAESESPYAPPAEVVEEPSVTLETVKQDAEVKALITGARHMMEALRYTDHSERHTSLIAERAGYVLSALSFSKREVEIAKIAGYLHDIGNAISRPGHELIGAQLAYELLVRLGCDYADAILVATAIANHDEGVGQPVNAIAAAVILSDKSDVHRSRVNNLDGLDNFDIHDRVNYAVTHSELTIDTEAKTCHLRLTVDTAISTVSDYFEIFLSRMLMCRHAALFLGLTFNLIVNDVAMM
ncbi:MAG TPA: HD domain-containing protein [Clostridiaceae bacterium]|jgi:metal-dependent HD superfamily phosphatase/phosphodiesterase|nr:HD domain-containing protein [Clostridiaceae bacterium]